MATPVNIDFITTENIEMLWEIILDDIKDNFRTKEQIAHARNFYINQARVFFEREKSINQNLIQMNKNFITEILLKYTSVLQHTSAVFRVSIFRLPPDMIITTFLPARRSLIL